MSVEASNSLTIPAQAYQPEICAGTDSPYKLIDIFRPEPDVDVVFSAHIDLDEHIFKSGVPSLFIDVIHAPGDIEERNHLLNVLIHHKRVRFARWLEDVIAGTCHPVVLEIAPGPLDHVAVNGRRMPVTAQNSGTADA